MSIIKQIIPRIIYIFSSLECSENDHEVTLRIMGGTIVTNQESVKHQVSIQLKDYPVSNGHICGGVIITLKKVLTAAHCVFLETDDADVLISASEFRIVAGILQLNKNSETAFTTSVSNITVHENYNPFTFQNDIAVMEVVSAFPENNKFIAPVQLRKAVAEAGTICQVTGWGRLFYVSTFGPSNYKNTYFNTLPGSNINLQRLKNCNNFSYSH